MPYMLWCRRASLSNILDEAPWVMKCALKKANANPAEMAKGASHRDFNTRS